MQTLDHIGSVPIVAIREKLLSKSLQSSVWTVVNSMASYIPTIKNLSLETIQKLLESVAEKLQFVKCLHTRFLLLPHSVDITHAAKDSIIPEWVNGSMHRTLYFINRTNTCILVSEPPPYISVFDVIAIVVSLVLGSPTPLPIGSLFVCPGGSETAIVDLLKLCSDKQEMEATSGSIGLVGKELLPQDVRQVQFHPLRPFYAGEIVAWRSHNGEKLKYGRVPDDVRPSAGQALYRFKVETSPGLMQPLISSHVFSFKIVAMGSETSPMPMDDVHIVDHSRTHMDMPETSGSAKSRASQVCPPLMLSPTHHYRLCWHAVPFFQVFKLFLIQMALQYLILLLISWKTQP